MLQQKVYKTRITDLELPMTPLTNDCSNDDLIQLGPFSVAVSVCHGHESVIDKDSGNAAIMTMASG